MCASYGIDPRYNDHEYREAIDSAVLDDLRSWAIRNNGEVLRPTGKNLRNLNPILTGVSSMQLAWWGHLVDGAPAKYASINTRSERLATSQGSLPRRAIVPVSYWREMAKPARVWHRLSTPENSLCGLAAVTRPGRTADGADYTCYSIVMQPAPVNLQHIHDRIPLLIGAAFMEEWLASPHPGGGLIATAIAASQPFNERILAVPEDNDNVVVTPERLF